MSTRAAWGSLSSQVTSFDFLKVLRMKALLYCLQLFTQLWLARVRMSFPVLSSNCGWMSNRQTTKVVVFSKSFADVKLLPIRSSLFAVKSISLNTHAKNCRGDAGHVSSPIQVRLRWGGLRRRQICHILMSSWSLWNRAVHLQTDTSADWLSFRRETNPRFADPFLEWWQDPELQGQRIKVTAL